MSERYIGETGDLELTDRGYKMSFRGSNEVILRIAPDGRVFWREREVQTDTELRAALVDLKNYLGCR